MNTILSLPKWSDVLIELYKTPDHRRYCQRINRTIKASPTWLREIVRKMVYCGLLEIEKYERINHLKLTEKGTRIAKSMLLIKPDLRF